MWILIDLDDTLVDNARRFREARDGFLAWLEQVTGAGAAAVAAAMEGPVRRRDFGRVGLVATAVQAYCALASACRSDEIREVVERADGLFAAVPRLMPGVPEGLARLRAAGHRLAVVTMGDPLAQIAKVWRAGLHRHFADAFVLPRKDVTTLRGVLGRLGLPDPGGRFVLIGNSPADDIRPALALGGWAVWVGGPQWPSEQAEVPPDPRLRRAADFPAAVEAALQVADTAAADTGAPGGADGAPGGAVP